MSSNAFEGLLWSETNVRTLIPATIAMVVFALLMRGWIGNRNLRIRNIPFAVISIFLLVLEIIKQYRDFNPGPYGIYSLPLHFSSIYLFLFPLAHFSKGSFSRTMRSVSILAAGMTTIGTLLFPMTVFGDSANGFFTNFGCFHTITYHYTIVLYFILFIALEMHEPDTKRDAIALIVLITVYAAIAAPLANLLEANFMSFWYNSFPPVERARLALGEIIGKLPAQILYDVFMYLGMLGSASLSTLLYRGLNSLCRRVPKQFRLLRREENA